MKIVLWIGCTAGNTAFALLCYLLIRHVAGLSYEGSMIVALIVGLSGQQNISNLIPAIIKALKHG